MEELDEVKINFTGGLEVVISNANDVSYTIVCQLLKKVVISNAAQRNEGSHGT